MSYIDPGVFGLISQIGYFLLFILVSVFMFFFGTVKKFVLRALEWTRILIRLRRPGSRKAVSNDEIKVPDTEKRVD